MKQWYRYELILILAFQIMLSACGKDQPTEPKKNEPDLPFWQKTGLTAAVTKLGVDNVSDSQQYGAIYGMSYEALYRSSDEGNTWTKVSNNLSKAVTIRDFVVHRNYIYAATAPKLGGVGLTGFVFRTPKGSDIWGKVDSGMPYNFLAEPLNFTPTSMVIAPFNIIIGGFHFNSQLNPDYGIFRSQTGENWLSSAIKEGVWEVDASNILGTPNFMLVIAGTDHGVYKSIDNGSLIWKKTSLDKEVYDVAINKYSSSGEVYAIASDSMVYGSIDQGTNWQPLTTSGGRPTAIQCPGDSVVMLGTETSGIFISRDRGEHWSALNDGIEKSGVGYAIVKEFLYNPVSDYLYAIIGPVLYRSVQPFK